MQSLIIKMIICDVFYLSVQRRWSRQHEVLHWPRLLSGVVVPWNCKGHWKSDEKAQTAWQAHSCKYSWSTEYV